MSVPTLTTKTVMQAIDELIIERGPDYVYDQKAAGGCFYSDENGAPGCFVGAIVAKLDPEAFKDLVVKEAPFDDGDGGVLGRIPAGDVSELVRSASINVESPTLKQALERLQSIQDYGMPWGTARNAFHEALRGW